MLTFCCAQGRPVTLKRILAISRIVYASQNRKIWVRKRCGPALAVCFISHALDAFAKRVNRTTVTLHPARMEDRFGNERQRG